MSRRRLHPKGFKLAALARMETVPDVRALAAELGIDRGLLYKWQRAYQLEGEAGLRLPGERVDAVLGVAEAAASGAVEGPIGSARVSALERKVAEQALELDFFRAALRHFAARRRETGGSGGTGSTP